MNEETKISVWVDRTSQPGKKAVIVSKDDESHSDTLRVFRFSVQKTAAIAFARREAKRRGVAAVIESPDRSGQWRPL